MKHRSGNKKQQRIAVRFLPAKNERENLDSESKRRDEERIMIGDPNGTPTPCGETAGLEPVITLPLQKVLGR